MNSMRDWVKGWLIVGLLLATMVYAIAEDITLTTYYPSPRGVYQELKTAGDMVVGDITNPPGARLHVVQEGTAPALRVDDVPGDTSPLVVDDEGNVGIGTASPSQRLHVAGDALIESGQLRVGNLSSDPAAIGDGAIYYNTASDTFRGFQGGAWAGLAGGGLQSVQAFSTPGGWSWNKPPGITKVIAEIWGGGGGGGGIIAAGGCGGGGGGYSKRLIDVSGVSSAVPVTVGAGGNGGTGGGAGSAGEISSFGPYASATGGGGGSGNSGAGGVGGAGSGGNVNMIGQGGAAGTLSMAGTGGSAAGGGGGGRSVYGGGGEAGGFPGGGGSGAWGAGTDGGHGADDLVVVWEYK